MGGQQIKWRIVTCQGSIQLVTAVAALRSREQGDRNAESSAVIYKDVLVFYGACPEEQFARFADFVASMADLLGDWAGKISLSPARLREYESAVQQGRMEEVYDSLREEIGVPRADEVYAATDWQLKNQLVLGAYPFATKVCCGDGLGIYYPQTAQAVQKIKPAKRRRGVKYLTHALKTIFNQQKSGSKRMPTQFDEGIFVLADVLGAVPPMRYTRLRRTELLNILGSLTVLVEKRYAQDLRTKIAGRLVSILLTANLSESGAVTAQNEIEAYYQFLHRAGVKSGSVLLIKPHPRDEPSKVDGLRERLSSLFQETVVLGEDGLAFLPFEVFLLSTVLGEGTDQGSVAQIYGVSSACLSLKYLFGIPVNIGFGEEITQALFRDSYVARRLTHEQELRSAIAKLDALGADPR